MIFSFVAEDLALHRYRFIAEALGVFIMTVTSILLAWTTPHPPMLEYYIMRLFGCGVLLWAAIARRSIGFAILNVNIIVIDSVGLVHTVMA